MARPRLNGSGRRAVLRTPVCDVLGIEVPIMQAAIWPATAPELVAAVSEAGGLGSRGAGFWLVGSVHGEQRPVRERARRPFAVNHHGPLRHYEAVRGTLRTRPAAATLPPGGHPGL